MKAALRKKVEANVKPPRYFAEFKKILCEEDPVKSLKRLHGLGGLRFLDSKLEINFQDLARMHRHIQGVKQKPLYNKNTYWWLIYFMGLIDYLDVNDVRSICRRFLFRKEEEKIHFEIIEIWAKNINSLVESIRGLSIFFIIVGLILVFVPKPHLWYWVLGFLTLGGVLMVAAEAVNVWLFRKGPPKYSLHQKKKEENKAAVI